MPDEVSSCAEIEKTATTESIRLIFVISDLHCGSTAGLFPVMFQPHEGNPIGQNALQQFLWQCWEDATGPWLNALAGDDPWGLVVLGDACEGNHHGVKEIISPDVADHLSVAEAVLRPLTERAAKTWVIEGTDVHVGNLEHALAKMLKAEPDPNSGKAAWPKLHLMVNGCPCSFAHHISTTSREYLRGSRLSIHLGNEQLAAINNGEIAPRVCGWGHCHIFDSYESGDSIGFTTPPWKMKDRHTNKVAVASRCKPGIVALDWRDSAPGGLPMLHSKTYRAPAPQYAEV